MAKRNIRKIAVLGSGVMGSRIACHFANIGAEVSAVQLRDAVHDDALFAELKTQLLAHRVPGDGAGGLRWR